MPRQTLEERFWVKVDRRGPDECWEWTASRNYQGYGRFWAEGKMVGAHRYSYELSVGSIPEGLTLDHLCRNRACVNPQHLEPVTDRENILRGNGPPARNARRTYCHRGHELTPDNIVPGSRFRECLTCRRASNRRTYEKRMGRPSAEATEARELQNEVVRLRVLLEERDRVLEELVAFADYFVPYVKMEFADWPDHEAQKFIERADAALARTTEGGEAVGRDRVSHTPETRPTLSPSKPCPACNGKPICEPEPGAGEGIARYCLVCGGTGKAEEGGAG